MQAGKKFLVISSLTLMILGCDTGTQEISQLNNSYVLVDYEGNIKKGDHMYTFNFFTNGKENFNNVFNYNGDLYYSYSGLNKNDYYIFGDGGLVAISKSGGDVRTLLDQPIHSVYFDEYDELYYYENYGLDESGNYKSKIVNRNSNKIIELDQPVLSFVVKDKKVYVLLSEDTSDNFLVFENQVLIEKKRIENTGALFVLDDHVFMLQHNGLYSISTEKIYSFDFNLKNTYYPVIVNEKNMVFFEMDDKLNEVIIVDKEAIKENKIKIRKKISMDGIYNYYRYSENQIIVTTIDSKVYLIDLERLEMKTIFKSEDDFEYLFLLNKSES